MAAGLRNVLLAYPCPVEGGGCLRSGELLPYRIVLKGTRAGILEGDLPPAAKEITELGAAFAPRTVPPGVRAFPIGVFAPERLGGAVRTVLPAREGAADAGGFVGTDIVVDLDKALGVFERGGGALAEAASKISRYGSPWTQKGRAYSSSHFSKCRFRSASIFGNSLAILLRIFSSRRRRVGSRFSPLAGFNKRREPS